MLKALWMIKFTLIVFYHQIGKASLTKKKHSPTLNSENWSRIQPQIYSQLSLSLPSLPPFFVAITIAIIFAVTITISLPLAIPVNPLVLPSLSPLLSHSL
jgi:hypothetical protein